ncbi:twin-arginine translocase subunit TatC [Streptantibioticus parmotrematis]|uniref:twin-arginine translocase subunit TatC n=1 Tax=Streptantibioticus parmotrematis TaxID=2873249 RepID=UPI0033FA9D3A
MLKSARKTKDPEGRMPLVDHLRELRNRLVKSLLAVGVVTAVAAYFQKRLIEFLAHPLLKAVGCHGPASELLSGAHPCANLTVSGILGPFSIAFKVALMAGVVCAAPVWLYQLWAFIAPGLHAHEKRYAVSFVGAGVPLFALGGYFAYTILPTSASVLLHLTPAHVTNLVPVDDYIDLVTRMVVVFGLAFELPLLLVLLNFGGILSGRRMLRWWRWMVMGITIFTAIATPTTDPVGMLALAVPIVVLYFVAVAISLVHDRRKEKRADDGLSPDEASDLDLTPEGLPAVEPVATPPALPEADRTDGFDDAT